MGKVYDKKRRMVLRQRQQRRAKLQKLKKLYLEAKTEAEKARIIEKVSRLAPHLSAQAYLSS